VTDGKVGDGREEEVARLVSGMAHELRNALQAIAINLEVVRTRLRRDVPELAEELERFAAAADDNVRRLGRRVELLVAAARSGPEEQPSTLDLPGLVREVAASLELDRRPPRVDVEAPEDERGVRVRRGAAVLLLRSVLVAARAAAEGEETVVAAVRYRGQEATLELPVPEPGREGWKESARRAGGRAAPAGEGPRARLTLRFPRA
jgi:nitrogen fixation/metabolism regulation signal transduction histidine kinase